MISQVVVDLARKLLADATTGKTLAAYEANEEVSGPMVCYAPDPDRFFIFSYHDGPQIVEAQPN